MPIAQISGPGVFINGGNALGADLTIGTLDAFSLIFVTNGTERARFTATGELIVVGPVVTINSTVVDIADRVIHVNSSTGANDPVPALISGLGVHRGAVAGVDRDHADIVWDEPNNRWNFAFNTGGDDITLGSDLNVKLASLLASADMKLLTNNKSLFGRNAANNADVEIARVNALDEVSIAAGGANVVFGGGNIDSHAAGDGSITLHANGTGHAQFHSKNGTLSLETQGGAIEIGNTNASRTISIGTGEGATLQAVTVGSTSDASTLTLNSGTGNIDIGTGAQARSVNVGTGAAAQTVTVGSQTNASSLTLNSGTGNIDIGTGAQARSINVGTGAAIQTITVGSTTAGSTLSLRGPSITAAATSTLSLNNSGGAIGIGNNADAQAINIGTGAAARTITIGNQTGATSVVLNAGTGNIDIGTTGQARLVNVGTGAAAQTVVVGSQNGASSLKLDSGTGNIDIGTGAQARAVNVGTGAAAQTVTVGSTTAGTTVSIQGPTIGIASSSALSINNSGGAINIGNNANAQAINLGTGAAARTITVGNTTAGTSLSLQGPTIGVSASSTLTINNSGGAIGIGTNADAQPINIGTTSADRTITVGNTSANTAIVLNAGGTGQVTSNARVNVKSAAGLYVTDASSNGIYINQAAGTTHQLVGNGTTTTLRVSTILEINNATGITALTDKTPSIGTEANRFNTVTSQTSSQKTHDAFTGSQHFTQTGAVQTTGNPVTTAFTYAVPDNSGVWFEVSVTARATASANRACFVRRGYVYRDSAGAPVLPAGPQVTIGTDYNPAGYGGVTISASGNNLLVQVQGATATTINWACTVRYQAVIGNT